MGMATCPLSGIAGCPLFRVMNVLKLVYRIAIGTFRIVCYIVSVQYTCIMYRYTYQVLYVPLTIDTVMDIIHDQYCHDHTLLARCTDTRTLLRVLKHELAS